MVTTISSPHEGTRSAHRGDKDPVCHLCRFAQELPFQTAATSTGSALKEKRLSAGLTQAEVADELGASTAVLSYVEGDHITQSFVKNYLSVVERLSEGRRAE
jgi:hypothetical protein